MLTKEEIEKKYPGKKLEDIKILNFYGDDFSNVDIISKMNSLEVISLSQNKISSLKPFQNLKHLKELILRNNNIENVNELDNLKDCNKLKSLWLEKNPVCKKDDYKKHIIEILPNLKKLDNINLIEIKEKNKSEKNNNNNKEKQIKNITIIEDKLEDLILDYEKDNDNQQKQENNELKNNGSDNNKNNLLGSKSDIFKSEIINKVESNNKENELPTKENTEINSTTNNNNNDNNNNNKLTESNKESQSSLGFSKIKMGSLANEPNNDLLNDILRNVDTSQSFIGKNNANQKNQIPPNLNISNKINMDMDSNKEEPKDKINSININLTKNLNDLIKDSNIDNNKNEIPLIHSKSNDLEVKNILDNVNSSQTILNKKEKEIKNILQDVQTSSSRSNFKDIDINNINDDNNINKVQSIDDIKKMFNDDYKPNGMDNRSNIYNNYNNNIRDTQINNIFKSEMISSDSFTRNSNSKQNGPYKPDFNIPNEMVNYNYYGYNNKPRRNYNIKPSHEHTIRAITNLLENLSLENLLIVKNQIINKLNGQI